MCGGLASVSSEKNSSTWPYQLGRLMAYLILGMISSQLAIILKLNTNSPYLILLPGIILGCLFIFWGIEIYSGKKAEIPMPLFLRKWYQFFYSRITRFGASFRPFAIGLISIFLPCGLLYGIVLGLSSFESLTQILLSIFFFWLGTLPSMILAPKIILQILGPIKTKLPKVFAIILITIGLTNLSYRISKVITIKDGSLYIVPESEIDCK
jgi:sulfite exporter TauE/SafE